MTFAGNFSILNFVLESQNAELQEKLIDIARESLTNREAPCNSPVGPDAACFVTLKDQNNALKGCVGTFEASDAIGNCVAF